MMCNGLPHGTEATNILCVWFGTTKLTRPVCHECCERLVEDCIVSRTPYNVVRIPDEPAAVV